VGSLLKERKKKKIKVLCSPISWAKVQNNFDNKNQSEEFADSWAETSKITLPARLLMLNFKIRYE
jgi:hypothetical protein